MGLRQPVMVVAIAAAGAVSSSALASTLREKWPNGGQVPESGEHHLELVVSGQRLVHR